MRANGALFSWLIVLLIPACVTAASQDIERVSPGMERFRRPVAIARLDEHTAVVANRCGTLTVIDLERWKVSAEYQIGNQLTDVKAVRGQVLVTDAGESCLKLIRFDRGGAQTVSTLSLPTYPVTIAVAADQASCSVASRWARKLSLVGIDEGLNVQGVVDLDFCPGEQLQIPARQRMLVADAFGGRLAVVNRKSLAVEAVHEFGAHNIRGLALSSDQQQLLISHQILNDAAFPRRSDIIWGVMIDNKIRVADVEKVLAGESNAVYRGRSYNVGYAGQGAGDPDAAYIDSAGRAVIALAGVNEVTVGIPDSRAFQRIGVGIRPTALLPLSTDRFIVVNELSDTLTLIDLSLDANGKKFRALSARADSVGIDDGANAELPGSEIIRRKAVDTESVENDRSDDDSTDDDDYEAADAAGSEESYSYDAAAGTYGRAYLNVDVYRSHLSLGKHPEPGPVERGERLFFSARLSHASWFSCHSCHVDGHTSGGRSDTFGDDTRGAPKRVLSLLGVSETGPWGWNGKKSTLPKQIHQSASSTMSGGGVSDQSAKDIAAFLKTLKAPPPYEPVASAEDETLVRAGRELFETLNCTDCHSGAVLTSNDAYDVGLEDELGLREFNPPSLRGVGYRQSLFHDRRAASLEDVLTKYRHQLDRPLNSEDLRALLRYLRSL